MGKGSGDKMEVEGAKRAKTEVPELKSFSKTLECLKTMVGQLVEDKRNGGGTGAAAQELAKRCITKVAEVRRDSRQAHDAADRLLREAEAERLRTDTVSQQLQNLQYQKIHLSRELNVCLSYKGTEGLDLISEEDFEAATTEEQRKGPRGSHDYELARLTVEMKKREEVIKALKQQELRRKLYEGKLAAQRKFLDGLSGHLDTIHAAAEPVRKEFNKSGAVPSLDKADANAASLLPAPLYSIYYQAHAYEVAFLDTATTAIVGDRAEALAYVKAQATQTPKSPSGAESKKRKRRKQLEEDGESLLAAHPLSVSVQLPPKEGAPATTPAITLTFSYLPRLQLVTVKHALSNKASEKALLQDLFPNDSGLLSPLPATDYLLLDPASKKPLRFSDATTAGRAYKWAQALAGLRYPPRDQGPPPRDKGPAAAAAAAAAGAEREMPEPPRGRGVGGRQEGHAGLSYGHVVGAVQGRVGEATEVKGLLAALARLDKEGPPPVPGSHLLPSTGATLEGWKEVTEEVVKAMAEEEGEDEGGDQVRMSDAEAREPGEAGEEGEVGVVHVTEKEVVEVGRRAHRYYRGVLAKGAWRVEAQVEVPAAYPHAAPVFSLSLLKEGLRKRTPGAGLMVGADPMALSAATVARQNGEATENGLRSMEEEVNWHARSEAAAAACPPAQLLAYQLWVALHCFSVFVDVEGGHQLNAPRDHRGRDRRLPFLYSPASRTLQQRV